MASQLFVFDEASVRKLKADHDKLAHEVRELKSRIASTGRTASPIPFLLGKVDADIAAGESGEVSIWQLDSTGTLADAGYNLTAYDWLLTGATTGDEVHLWRHQQSGRLYFGKGSAGLAKARMIRFTLSAALTTADASKANCDVKDYWDGPNPGSTVTVWNSLDDSAGAGNYLWAGDSGATGFASYDPVADRYKVIALECPPP